MNKKLVILIVSVVVIMSIVFVAVLGSEAYGSYAKQKVTDIYFVKSNGDYYSDLAAINLISGKETYDIGWKIAPTNAEDKRITVSSSNPKIATVSQKGERIIVTFLNPDKPQPVNIVIKSVDMGKIKTICFIPGDSGGTI